VRRAKHPPDPQTDGLRPAVKKALTAALYARAKPKFRFWSSPLRTKLHVGSSIRSTIGLTRFVTNGGTMSVVAYVLLTVAVFAVLGFAQKLVEKL
jgi:hypothetical protein